MDTAHWDQTSKWSGTVQLAQAIERIVLLGVQNLTVRERIIAPRQNRNWWALIAFDKFRGESGAKVDQDNIRTRNIMYFIYSDNNKSHKCTNLSPMELNFSNIQVNRTLYIVQCRARKTATTFFVKIGNYVKFEALQFHTTN